MWQLVQQGVIGRVMRWGVGVCLLLGLAVTALSYAGALHPVGDSLAVFRLWLAGGLLLGAVAAAGLGMRRVCVGVAGIAGVAGLPIVALFLDPGHHSGGTPDVTVYSKNTLGGWGDDAAIVRDILETRADVVLLQEVSRSRSDFAGALVETHPYVHMCKFSDGSGIDVMSRWPVENVYCSPQRSFAAAFVATPDGGFWAVSTHLVWPYPYAQSELLDQALPFLNSIEGPAIVAGDFNMVPWGASVRRIEAATGAARIGTLRTTLRVGHVPLQIDHVLTTGQGEVALRPLFGTDHHGLVARIVWPAD